jgi:plastocyanin
MTSSASSAPPRLNFYKFIVFLCLLAVTTSCTTPPQPRTEISVTMQANAFQPAAWRVPAGQQITVHFTNQDAVAHDWTILFRNVSAPFSADDEPYVYWRASVPAGSSLTATFQAPAAAANYPVVCSTPGHLENGMLGRLTVVQPQTTP